MYPRRRSRACPPPAPPPATPPCFPAKAQVRLADGKFARLDALKAGDTILAVSEDGTLTSGALSTLSIDETCALLIDQGFSMCVPNVRRFQYTGDVFGDPLEFGDRGGSFLPWTDARATIAEVDSGVSRPSLPNTVSSLTMD